MRTKRSLFIAYNTVRNFLEFSPKNQNMLAWPETCATVTSSGPTSTVPSSGSHKTVLFISRSREIGGCTIRCGWLWVTPKLPIFTAMRICTISFSANGKFLKSYWRTRSFPIIVHSPQSTLTLPLYGVLCDGGSVREIHLGVAGDGSAFGSGGSGSNVSPG